MMYRSNFYLILFIFAIPCFGFAQEAVWINESTEKSPLLVLITEAAQYDTLHTLLSEYKSSQFFLVKEGSSVEFVQHALNGALNDRTKQFDKQRVSLILVGDVRLFSKYNRFEGDLFSAMYWLNTGAQSQENIGKFKNQAYEIAELTSVFDQALSKRRWEVDIERIQTKYARTFNVRKHGKKEKGIGLSYSRISPFGNHSEGTLPLAFNALTFNQYRILNKHWSIHTDITASFGLPDPRADLQEQLLGQVDLNALLNGEKTEVSIDATLKGHLYAALNVQAHYRWEINERFAPFVGAGLSYGILQGIELELDTIIVIDPSEGLGGGFGGGLGAGGEIDRSAFLSRNGGENSGSNYSGFGFPVSLGFHYRLHPSVVFNASLQYHQHIRNPDTGRVFMQNSNFQVGLIFALIGKRHTHYNYVRLKPKALIP